MNDDTPISPQDIKRLKSPIKILRGLMKKSEELKPLSGQSPFATTVGCSVSLIRAVEQEQTEISVNLAKNIERVIGVSAEWLFSSHLPEDDIPAAGGGALTCEKISDRIKGVIADTRNLSPLGKPMKEGNVSMEAKVSNLMSDTIKDLLLDSFTRGDLRLKTELDAIIGNEIVRRNGSPTPGA